MADKPSFDNLQNILNNIDTDDIKLDDKDLLKKIQIDPEKEITEEKLKQIQELEQELEEDKEIKTILKADKITIKDTEEDVKRVQKKVSKHETYLQSQVLGGNIKVALIVSEDKLQAFLDIKADGKGHSLDTNEVTNYIQNYGINFGIIQENIDKINDQLKENEEINDLLIAQGKEEQVGEDAKLEFKIENNTSLMQNYILQKAEDEKKTFDNPEEKKKYIDTYLKDNELFINITPKNEIVLQKLKPTKGEDGKEVTGEIIPGKTGKDLNIRIKRNLNYEAKTQTYTTDIEGLFIFENNVIWCKHYKPGNYTIELINDNNTMKLTITPSVGGAEPVNVEQVLKGIKEASSQFTGNREKITEKIEQAEKLHQLIYFNMEKDDETEKDDDDEFDIPEKKKIKYEFHFSESRMEAYMDIIADEIGLTVDEKEIRELIEENEIKYGVIDINVPQINSLLNEMKEIQKYMIAKGSEPEKGDDGHLAFKVAKHPEFIDKYILKQARDHKVTFESVEEQKKYIEQYKKEKRVFVSIVPKGQILAQLLAPQEGKEGIDVFGNTIPTEPGKEISIKVKRNIKFEPTNQIYISERGGLFIFDNYTMWCQMYTDGDAKIDLIEEEMKAQLTITPSLGGADPVDPDELYTKIQKMGIEPLYEKNMIAMKIKEAESTHEPVILIIGKGTPAQNGKDAELEYKVKLATGKQFKKLDGDRIDYKEKDAFTAVHKDQLIAVLHKPGKAIKDGKTVTGKQIISQAGKDLSITPGKNVTTKDFDDRTELYSDLDGHLKEDLAGIHVFPVYMVKEDVDLSVGNIKFNGDIVVQGNVQDEFTLIAEGDILIYGNVGNCVLQSKGNIVIKNGFFGKDKGRIICKGDLTAKFIENGTVECDNNIIIDREIVNSIVRSNDTISVRGSKGYVIGGQIFCGRKMEANVVGSKAGVKTKVFLGHNFKIKRFLEQVKEKRVQIGFHLKRVEEILGRLIKKEKDITKYEQDSKKIYVESLQKKIILMNQLKQLKKKESSVNKDDIFITPEPELWVYDTLYPDVTIQYLNKNFIINEHYSSVCIGKFDAKGKVSIKKMRSS